MISIKDILPNSIIFICGTLSKENNFEKSSTVINNNLFIYKNSKQIFFILNRKDDISTEEFDRFILFAKNVLPNSIFLIDHINRNYQIGFMDQDIMGLNYLRFNNIEYEYIIKQTLDIILYEPFIDLTFEPSDLLFIPELTCLDKNINDSNLRESFKEKTYDKVISNKEFNGSWPQPWLIIISKNVKQLYDCDDILLRNIHSKWIINVNGDLSRWHDQNSILCSEHYLTLALCNKNLTKYCLMSKKDFDIYCNFIVSCQIGDATIKNVYLENYGICHWHSKNDPIISVEF